MLTDAGGDLPRGEHPSAGGGQLDRERIVVEQRAQLGAFLRVERSRSGLDDPGFEQAMGCLVVQRAQADHRLGRDPQPDPAGREHRDRRRVGDQRFDERRNRRCDVLAVVEHDERSTVAEVVEYVLGRCRGGVLPQPECRRDSCGDRGRSVGQWSQVDEPHAVGERRSVPAAAGNGGDAAALADPTGPDDRDEPSWSQRVLDRRGLGSIDELVRFSTQVVGLQQCSASLDGWIARRLVDRQVESGVLFEDLSLQQSEVRARLDAEFIDKEFTCVPVRAQRLGLTTGAVQGEQVQRPEVLTEGVLVGERRGVVAAGLVVAQPESGGEQCRQCAQAQLAESAETDSDRRKVEFLGRRSAPPHRGRPGCGLGRSDRVRVEESLGGAGQVFELGDIDGESGRGERVARAPGLEVDGRTERTTKTRHLNLHHVARSFRWFGTPQRLAQRVDADDLVEVVRQGDQDGLGPGSADVDGRPVDRDRQWPEHVDARSGSRRPLHPRSIARVSRLAVGEPLAIGEGVERFTDLPPTAGSESAQSRRQDQLGDGGQVVERGHAEVVDAVFRPDGNARRDVSECARDGCDHNVAEDRDGFVVGDDEDGSALLVGCLHQPELGLRYHGSASVMAMALAIAMSSSSGVWGWSR